MEDDSGPKRVLDYAGPEPPQPQPAAKPASREPSTATILAVLHGLSAIVFVILAAVCSRIDGGMGLADDAGLAALILVMAALAGAATLILFPLIWLAYGSVVSARKFKEQSKTSETMQHHPKHPGY